MFGDDTLVGLGSCGANFHLIDAFDDLHVRCTLDIHDGPHIDEINNYTWGRIEGPDGYTERRRQRQREVEARRKTSALNILRRRRNPWQSKAN